MMFRLNQDSEKRKIRLPRRILAPTVEYLQFIVDQALQYRGQEVEVAWSDPFTTKQYSLIAKTERDKNYPCWVLWTNSSSGEAQLVWSYETVDIELINNMLSMLDTSTKSQEARAVVNPANISSSRLPASNATHSLRDSLGRIRSLPVELSDISVTTGSHAAQRQSQKAEVDAAILSSITKTNQVVSLPAEIQDQLRHLEKAGLNPQAQILKRREELGENELSLLLKKSSDVDVSYELNLYKQLNSRFTFAQFLSEHLLKESIWVPIFYKFYVSGLIEIKPPLAVNEQAFNFLGEAKGAIQALQNNFIRTETGILSYPGLLYFLQYEFLRYQSYGWPLSLVVFEMNKRTDNILGGVDLINKQETLTALQRIIAAKRPLDQLGHFEAVNFALLLPNTINKEAIEIVQRIMHSITEQPLAQDLDSQSLKTSFGVVNIPNNTENIEGMITLGKRALMQAKVGQFPIVEARDLP